MKSLADSTVKPMKQLVSPVFIILLLAGVISITLFAIFPIEKVYILLPTLATIIVFLVFSIILKKRVGDNLFGELGFVYLALAVAYTVFPALTFLVIDLNLASGWVWEKLSLLLPAPYELGIHLWRHVIFISGVAAGYLIVRGRGIPRLGPIVDPKGKDGPSIVFLIMMISVCILGITMLSAPVTTYIDHYTRFDHLSWFALRFVYLCLLLKVGCYFILITFLFRHYQKFKLLIIFTVLVLCTYETAYSFGSRIETLTILLGVVCLYHYTVKPITLKMGLMSFLAIATLFSALELFRSSGFNLNVAQDAVSREGGMPASEFGAVYFTSFHLYAERTQGTLPKRELAMFFNDFISLIPFVDHTQWNPQYWYARHFFPDAVVPPQTMGPIADSAIWGGEIDLLLRSLVNGAIFAYVVRWFLHRKDKWWGVVIYIYCYATCVMTLKYSVFYQLTPLLKILLPTLLLVAAVRRMIPLKRSSGVLNNA
jgi:hypothetical protein